MSAQAIELTLYGLLLLGLVIAAVYSVAHDTERLDRELRERDTTSVPFDLL
jgi:hypothetical protein